MDGRGVPSTLSSSATDAGRSVDLTGTADTTLPLFGFGELECIDFSSTRHTRGRKVGRQAQIMPSDCSIDDHIGGATWK